MQAECKIIKLSTRSIDFLQRLYKGKKEAISEINEKQNATSTKTNSCEVFKID